MLISQQKFLYGKILSYDNYSMAGLKNATSAYTVLDMFILRLQNLLHGEILLCYNN